MNIKPGMLCYLVNLVGYPELNGRAVTVVRPHQPPRSWVIEAGWLPSFFGDRRVIRLTWALEFNLRPIHDPDADLTENHDEELTA